MEQTNENFVFNQWKEQWIFACIYGKTEVVKILLEHPRSQTIDWNAKMMWLLAFKCSCKIVRLDHGLNGKTDCVYSCGDPMHTMVELKNMAKEEKNRDFIYKPDHGQSALHYASIQGHSHMVKLLLDYSKKVGIEVNGKSDGRTPLHAAWVKGHDNIVKAFLDYARKENRELWWLLTTPNQVTLRPQKSV